MLVEFTVENYKSFRDRTTLSMVAAKITSFEKSLDEENVIDAKPNLKLLRSAGIYGANASGKSNLASALGFMRSFVIGSARELQVEDRIETEPFLLNVATENEPSLFEVVFAVEEIEYRYGFQANTERVISEWLYARFSTKETTLFTRDEQSIKIGSRFREAKGLEERTRPNALFLSLTAQFNGSLSTKLIHWFRYIIITTGLQDREFLDSTVAYLKNTGANEIIAKMINQFDLGIENITLQPPNEFPVEKQDSLLYHYQLSMGEFDTVNVVRDVYDGNNVVNKHSFGLLTHESQGTQKLFALSIPILLALQYGYLMVIDELDARLHPLITRAIIKLFNSPTTNPKQAQFIFITHDTNLLDKSLLRRDQVWFAEKDRQGATHLASLVEYKPRNDESFEKNYIQGRYGAIPFLGDLTRLPVAADA